MKTEQFQHEKNIYLYIKKKPDWYTETWNWNVKKKYNTLWWHTKKKKKMQELKCKNILYVNYMSKSALNLCVTIDEWWQPQYHIHITHSYLYCF